MPCCQGQTDRPQTVWRSVQAHPWAGHVNRASISRRPPTAGRGCTHRQTTAQNSRLPDRRNTDAAAGVPAPTQATTTNRVCTSHPSTRATSCHEACPQRLCSVLRTLPSKQQTWRLPSHQTKRPGANKAAHDWSLATPALPHRQTAGARAALQQYHSTRGMCHTAEA